MAGVEAADAAGKIEIAIAVHVFDDGSCGTGSEDGRGVRRAARDGGFAAGHQRAGSWARDFGAKLNGFHDCCSVSESKVKTRTLRDAGCGTHAYKVLS